MALFKKSCCYHTKLVHLNQDPDICGGGKEVGVIPATRRCKCKNSIDKRRAVLTTSLKLMWCFATKNEVNKGDFSKL